MDSNMFHVFFTFSTLAIQIINIAYNLITSKLISPRYYPGNIWDRTLRCTSSAYPTHDISFKVRSYDPSLVQTGSEEEEEDNNNAEASFERNKDH